MARHQALHDSQPVSGETRQSRREPTRSIARETARHDERRLERPNNRRMSDDGRFSIDFNGVPDGWVMEWKRHSIMAMTDRRNQVLVRQYHWEPVPHKMQPQIYGHTCKNDDEHIVVDGQGLYMRPAYLNEDAMAESKGDTDYMLQQQLQSLRMSSKDQVGDRNTYIRKQTVAVSQPVE